MNYDYLAKIKSRISLYTKKKTSNLLDGEFRSVHRGRSFDFDDLREYTYGDNVKDIDWKSSSKTGKVLIRRYIADKKHNILFVCDTGHKMMADTPSGEAKADVALETLGTIGYLVESYGADYATIYSTPMGYDFSYFKSGKVHFENMLTRFKSCAGEAATEKLSDILMYVSENIRRRMIIFIITDMEGVSQITDDILRHLTVMNDVMIACIDDAYVTDGFSYDMDEDRYEYEFLSSSKALREAEHKEREERMAKGRAICARYNVSMVTVKSEEEVVDRVVELFERHRNENVG